MSYRTDINKKKFIYLKFEYFFIHDIILCDLFRFLHTQLSLIKNLKYFDAI